MITKDVVFSTGMSVDGIKLCDCTMVSEIQASRNRKLEKLGITNTDQLISKA